jgi:hypothetical protein
MTRIATACAFVLVLLAACGGSSGSTGDGGPVADGAVDGDGALITADGGGGMQGDAHACTPTGPQCDNCIDDDNDGVIDGADPECTGLSDNDEGSFATAIPGDNIDAKTQDCFFDGNSGGGDDKCAYHTCCLLGAASPAECPSELQPPNYDPTACTASDECRNNCAPLTPPGCDCFGCCTICDGAGCANIIINPAVAPNCDYDVLHDATMCPTCTPSTVCNGGTCDPANCVLCPGQTEADLPPSCTTQACPAGEATCEVTADCPNGFCSNGCCLAIID